MPFEKVSPTRLYQRIAVNIAEMIQAGELKPGERLPSEGDLVKRLGVGRSAVREALIALETGGLIEVRNGDGSYVRNNIPSQIRMGWDRSFQEEPGPFEQFEMRELLEPEASARAAKRITPEQIAELERLIGLMKETYPKGLSDQEGYDFHTLVGRASGNSILANTIEELWRLRNGELWRTLRERLLKTGRRQIAIDKRIELVAAFRARDPRAARSIMKSLLASAKRTYFRGLLKPDTDGQEALR